MDTQTTTNVSEHYLVVAKDLLANGNSVLAQRLLQMATGGEDPGETQPVKVAGKRGKPNRSGGNHPLAEKALAWVSTQRFVTTPSLIAHFPSLKGEGGQYQANKLLQWLESEGVVSAGRAVLANVTREEAVSVSPGVPARAPKAKKVKAAKKGERIRRTNDEIQKVSDKFFQIVTDNPGQRMEQLRGLLDMTAHELMKPVALLIEQDLIRTEGDKRGTAYFATVDDDSVKPAKKASGTKRASTKKASGSTKKAESDVAGEELDIEAAAAVGGVEVVEVLADAPAVVALEVPISEVAVTTSAI